jgi:hypothetical protein
MDYTFKKHSISPAEKLWLTEASKSEFDPKATLAKLWKDLPPDFNSARIDFRLYNSPRPTLIGLWYVDPDHKVLGLVDATVRAAQELIVENPGINELRVDIIARKANLSEDDAYTAIYHLGQLGNYYTAASGPSGRPTSIELGDERSYSAFLRHQGIDDLLEEFYVARGTASSPSLSFSVLDTGLSDLSNFNRHLLGPAIQPVKQVNIKKGVAFVLMAIDPGKPELEDIYNAIKDTCKEFGIQAYRADEIQHQDRITEVILQEISTCEYLIADLTYERPNVYYEVGFAHALDKKPILYRKAGTPLHFDLRVHNVPEYKNATEVRKLLRLRLEAITGRSPVAS